MEVESEASEGECERQGGDNESAPAAASSPEDAAPTVPAAPAASSDLAPVREPASASPALQRPQALSYLQNVQQSLAAEPQLYEHFLQLIRRFKQGQLDRSHVVERVGAMFAGRDALLQGFNAFLPADMQIDPSALSPPVATSPPPHPTPSHPAQQQASAAPPAALSAATDFIREVQRRFAQQQPETYAAFLHTLERAQLQQNQRQESDSDDAREIEATVRTLFRGHDDLIQGFRQFLPHDAAATQSGAEVPHSLAQRFFALHTAAPSIAPPSASPRAPHRNVAPYVAPRVPLSTTPLVTPLAPAVPAAFYPTPRTFNPEDRKSVV